MNKIKGPVIVITACLMGFAVSFQTGTSINLLSCIVIVSPLLLILTAYFLLKDKDPEFPESGENDVWEFLDGSNDNLEIF